MALRARFVRAGLLTLGVAALLSIGPAIATATAQQRIGPNQHFLGLVNGSNDDPVVHVVCPGPISPGRTGPVVSGQTMSVAHVAKGGGYTGLFSQVYAWFVPGPSPTPVSAGAFPPALRFTEYGVPQPIPNSFQVPCGGTGQVEFSSCPYLAPCAAGWIPNYVTVHFEDIAA